MVNLITGEHVVVFIDGATGPNIIVHESQTRDVPVLGDPRSIMGQDDSHVIFDVGHAAVIDIV